MNIFHRKIDHPTVAFVVIFIVGALLNQYGIIEGSLLIFDFFAGVVLYRFLTA